MISQWEPAGSKSEARRDLGKKGVPLGGAVGVIFQECLLKAGFRVLSSPLRKDIWW